MADRALEEAAELTVQYNAQGLIPAIVQDVDSGQVLMMAWMNEAALKHTLENGRATFYSRSRDRIWVKGESSGHVLQVLEARIDCDQDTLLLRCRPHGPACHAGYQSCFYRSASPQGDLKVVEEKVFDPDSVYGG